MFTYVLYSCLAVYLTSSLAVYGRIAGRSQAGCKIGFNRRLTAFITPKTHDYRHILRAAERETTSDKKLYLVNPRGFCEGVSRAIRTVEETVRIFGPPIYVKHEIVHNEAVCNRLRAKGVVFIEDLNLVPENSIIIYSAHGISPEIRELAKSRNLVEIDASCPLVNKVHVYVKNKAKEGYKIVLIGHKNHQEIIGTSGEAPEAVTVVENVSDVQALDFPTDTKLFYVTQTTLSLDDCKHIKDALVAKYPHIETIPSGSICYATTNRQTAIHKVTKLVDMVLIVGSKLSSNAKRLVEAALNRDVKSYLVFDADDVTEELVGSARNIALSSSASTPEDLTQAVMDKLSSPPFNFVVEEFDGAVERVPNWRLPRYFMFAPVTYNNV
ncbi:4-hydroxy-3-methylbut-2-enyl diphosphate reductase [Theileria orientalis strain Shintoku]|uniref:4-hydroxy-3-methylbut-2-enyl diphosphate reductase n=1 Tax=Theileria orientalis strain Shintoku TaxID=869250 RepID=J4CDD2_THEOR|nr:4-hydroxy-3-methylbut-2-enyl diphosphate reductase [Theileria orientalis strain Shintoku]BAM40937.1 4-hydroxy-3-methylbut-2-enyl diphosphate reductase [Theileria orientalis strain Shintoku]|eukprot:XP_009691238.1 4-hydroxy-3-methylbut-2-enyl diphosphate reductase [Theileria orientalis strain Shintoku]